jgi:hypothetical protein
MLIGNRERFALELTPVEPSWTSHYKPEAAAWAGLSVWVAGRNLCAHVLDGEEDLRAALFVPLGPVADWIVRSYPGIAFEERLPWFETSRRVHDILRKWGESRPPIGVDEDDWLDQREAFWSRHFLMAGAEGAWLPNLGFLREDDEVALIWAPARFRSGPGVAFLSSQGMASASWSEVDAVLGRFVDEVAKAFVQKGLTPYDWVAKPGPRLRAVIGANSVDPVALFCARPLREVAALLGILEKDIASTLGVESLRDPAANALCQVLRDLPPQPSPGIGVEARATVESSANDGGPSTKAWMAGRTVALDAARAGATAEAAGQLAALGVRSALRLNGQPIASTDEVLGTFGVATRQGKTVTQHEHMLVAAVDGNAPVATLLLTEQTRTKWGRRFEEARALGHALLDPLRGRALGAASTKWAQDTRRRRSGAFAAELLLPASALEKASGGHLDAVATNQAFQPLLTEYGVGARTAAFQLYNRKLVSKPVRDELIARYGKDE